MIEARILGVSLIAATMIGTAATTRAEPPELKPLVGTFVGRAEQVDLRSGAREQRDIDIMITPYEHEGLKINWTNVTLVDGRRDVPGVKRRSDEILLSPAPDRAFYLAGVNYDPFHARGETNPMAGDPLRWGVAKDGSLDIYSFAILEDGSYELQVFERRSTEEGIALGFDRIVDGELVRQLHGRAVRAE